MLVRVEHIDGTLESAVSLDGLDLLEEVGTTFALPDGRWVQVIGHERDSDGSIRYVIVGKTPDVRTYSAKGHEAYVREAGEWSMGSEQYGTLMLDGSPLDVRSRAEVRTRIIVIDAESREVVGGSEERSGHASPLLFVGRSVVYDADDEDSWVNLRF